MRLLPEDLGTRWHIALVRQRALGPAVAWTRPTEPRVGRLGRLWTRDMGISEEVNAATLPVAANETQGYTFGVGLGFGWIPLAITAMIGSAFLDPAAAIAATGAAGAGWSWLTGYHLPRRSLRRLHETPVSAEEIETLRTSGVPGLPPSLGQMAQKFFRLWNRGVQEVGADELEQAYLALVLDALRSDSIPEAAQPDLRATLRALGDAVFSLPSPSEMEAAGAMDAADLRGDAELLLARARREPDEVVAASLVRQADALLERARAADNVGVMARRTRFLRQELSAQIGALRAALPSFGRAASSTAASRAETSSFTRLAESVRSVAAEAASVAAAHEELHQDSVAHRVAGLEADEQAGSAEAARDATNGYRSYSPPVEEAPQIRLRR